MALLEIPTRNDLPSYEEQVTLDGTPYILQFYFNPRTADGIGKWYVTLADRNRNMLCSPVPVVVNWPLFDRFVEEIDMPGTIFAFDTTGNNTDPAQFDLGNTVRLFYLEGGST